MAEEAQGPKWEGKVTAELKNLRAEQVWLLLEDFCNLHKILPYIDTCYQLEGVPCYQLEGVPKQPGLIRYCTTASSSFAGGFDEPIKWAKEKLLSINPIERCISYEVLDNNVGFKSYVATIKVVSINGDDENKQGCRIEWSFVADPIQGWRSEDLVLFVDNYLQTMANKIEETIESTV